MAEIDFDQFMKVLDAALGSNDPNVKKALRKFLFVAALAMGDDPEPGPFSDMLKSMDKINKRIDDLERNADSSKKLKDYYTTTTTTPQWIYDPTYYGGSSTGGSPNINWGGSTTSGGCTGFTSASSTYTINVGDWAAEPEGERMEREIKEKLENLLK